MNIYLQILIVTVAGGLLSLAGGLALLSNKRSAKKLAALAVPFAAGALLGAAFFELLPEAFSSGEAQGISMWVLSGIVAFFLLEYFIHWFHHEHNHTDAHQKSTALLVIIGDTIHNLIDGIAVGAAFLISPATGIVAAVAVASHEIPQEIGDFGLLLKYGYRRKKVILINIFSALAATVGAITTFWVGSQAQLPVNELLAITGGLFIYIASSDLIPAIHHDTRGNKAKISAALLLVSGLFVVYAATETAHSYLENSGNGHSHETQQHIEEDTGHDHEGYELSGHGNLPTVSASLVPDTKGGYNLHVEVTGFLFRADKAGSEPVANEGHAHIYVNGEKVARLYGTDFHLPMAEEGDEVKVTLNAHNHAEFTHHGEAISDTVIAGSEEEHDDHDNH